MPVKNKTIYLKIIFLYLCYNLYLKIFFSLANDLIYIGYPHNMKSNLFFQCKGDNMYAKITSIVSVNIIYDLFWFLPFTIMNIYIFIKILRYAKKDENNLYQYGSFTILKVYFFWVLVSFCSIGFGFLITETYHGLNGPLAPYGSLTITYLLLGNFVYLLSFVPLWNKYIKNWLTYTDN